ncbi:Alcohol dehydrogenase transcription factor Myb/SANT-like [Popillia japonica]|uniref:Alcohol dehydrogenase transcription factor Myb/SANT-like n=1 Tax=Popillia japonica TaxID=7064 RepID=A0AAW1L435_POPJA
MELFGKKITKVLDLEDLRFIQFSVDGTVWQKNHQGSGPGRSPFHTIFREISGPTGYAKRNIMKGKVRSAFSLILDQEIMNHIKMCTESEARRVLGSEWSITLEELDAFIAILYAHYEGQKSEARRVLGSEWSITLEELDAFIAILYALGAYETRNLNVSYLWNKKWGPVFFSRTMNRNRFTEIMRFIRFDRRSERSLQTDKFALISKCATVVLFIMVFKWKDDHTPLILSLMKDRQCLWNTKAETRKNKVYRENALKEIVKELNIQDVTVEDIKLKIKTIRTRYSSELTKVNKSVKCGTGSDDVYVPKLFWYKQADTFLHAVCIPRSSTGTALKIKYEGLKRVLKKKKQTNKGLKRVLKKKKQTNARELFKTAGGTPILIPYTDYEEKLLSVLLLSVEGLSPEADSDANLVEPLNNNFTEVENEYFSIEIDEELGDVRRTIFLNFRMHTHITYWYTHLGTAESIAGDGCETAWKVWTPGYLRTPISGKLKTQARKAGKQDINEKFSTIADQRGVILETQKLLAEKELEIKEKELELKNKEFEIKVSY